MELFYLKRLPDNRYLSAPEETTKSYLFAFAPEENPKQNAIALPNDQAVKIINQFNRDNIGKPYTLKKVSQEEFLNELKADE